MNATILTRPLTDSQRDTGETNKHRPQGHTRACKRRQGHGRGRDKALMKVAFVACVHVTADLSDMIAFLSRIVEMSFSADSQLRR